MAVLLEQIGAELSVIRAGAWKCAWNKALHYCRTELISRDAYDPTPDDDLLHDVLLKTLLRGCRPFVSYFAEQKIVSLYGGCFSLQEDGGTRSGSISYSYHSSLPERYRSFTNVLDPWSGRTESVAFDPNHPENERELFRLLLERFGPRIGHCITPQAEISSILPTQHAADFTGQRVDFLLSFPNRRCLVLEPGDHDTAEEIARDRGRDDAFRQIGTETLRQRNAEIPEAALYDQIDQILGKLGVKPFLGATDQPETDEQHAAAHLFLLPSLVVRLERLLAHFLLRQGLIRRAELRIGVIERDLKCAEIGVASFLDRLNRLSRLYGIHLQLPTVQLFVIRTGQTPPGARDLLDLPVEVCSSETGLALDLLLDVGIKCNSLTRPVTTGAPHVGSVRQTFPHNQPVRFGYRARVRPIVLNGETDELLESFTRDFFRKRALRPGQAPILRNILAQKATIGLLPTSAGKSLCYQLASLLTPGTTLVVDPIVALMQDQVQSLKEQFGIGRVLAWHSGSGLHDQNVGALLSRNLMLFISPERFQRRQFRDAMRAMNAADMFINYAVIDEAHCVSMWGHDFRPSYLTLGRNVRECCTFQSREPVMVALTGTASQLVLIDLKRELNIQDPDAIVRPKTFDREELRFSLVRCPSDDAPEMLDQVMTTIAQRLNVQQLDTDAHGIVFAYTRPEVWDLFGRRVGNATDYVNTVLNGNDHDLRYGVYTGSAPPAAGLNPEQWETYKAKTLAAFKRGAIHMLFGTTAVSVGIDNERLNYIVNYAMPQSMEAYYQQCGRAGRAGQKSECYLIFSDDLPVLTKQWLNREIAAMPNRWDDLGTVAYFHQGNFPGQTTDIAGAMEVFQAIFGAADGQGFVGIPQFNQRTEQYVSYWLIVGVLVDYEVTGTQGNTRYRVRRHTLVEQFLGDHNEAPLRAHLIDRLHLYKSRYRPTPRSEVARDLTSRHEHRLSEKIIACLIEFIYSEIEYQRREAIRTMVSYCNEPDNAPERLRARIRAYFDSSEKFSEGLMRMADVAPDFSAVSVLLDRVDSFDDAEQLYWETRRLLDERFRPDWAAANLFSIVHREKGACSDPFLRLFEDMVTGFSVDQQFSAGAGGRFLASFMNYLCRLDNIFGDPVCSPLIAECMGRLYKRHGMRYLEIVDEMPAGVREHAGMMVVNLQLGEIIDANCSRVIG